MALPPWSPAGGPPAATWVLHGPRSPTAWPLACTGQGRGAGSEGCWESGGGGSWRPSENHPCWTDVSFFPHFSRLTRRGVNGASLSPGPEWACVEEHCVQAACQISAWSRLTRFCFLQKKKFFCTHSCGSDCRFFAFVGSAAPPGGQRGTLCPFAPHCFCLEAEAGFSL